MAKNKSVVLLGYEDEVVTEKHKQFIDFTTNKIGGDAVRKIDFFPYQSPSCLFVTYRVLVSISELAKRRYQDPMLPHLQPTASAYRSNLCAAGHLGLPSHSLRVCLSERTVLHLVTSLGVCTCSTTGEVQRNGGDGRDTTHQPGGNDLV
jgi:hypothetical protein